jgi:hypothetical protein
LVAKYTGHRKMTNLNVDGKTILLRISKKDGERVWRGFNWHRVGDPVVGSFEQVGEPWLSSKG